MPSIFGILISVMMTSYSAPSILFFAACPDCTVSTLWPSRRKEMSSISQMERSSSQTRMLAMRTSCSYSGTLLRRRSVFAACQPLHAEAMHSKHECGTHPWPGARPYLALMRLHDLVHDCES